MSLQKFSVFHETSPDVLKAWHEPYARLFVGHSSVLDVGCGPGYFSELITALGERCVGLDLDPAMVRLSLDRGHEAHLGDQRWIAQKAGCFGGVHISHVVEHLWGDDLVVLLENAVSALSPGGILVIRTPNWENRTVRERLFWMDHTHKRPYPRELLARMLTDLGMEETQSGAEPFGMNDVFVVATKPPYGKGYSPVLFPASPKAERRSLKPWLRRKLRRFLSLE